MVDFFLGVTSQPSIDKNIRKIEIGNLTLYNDEKLNGYFVEEYLYNLSESLNIVNKSILYYYQDKNYHYCSFINDMKMRESLKYSKEHIYDDNITVIIEDFVEEDIDIFINIKTHTSKEMVLSIYSVPDNPSDIDLSNTKYENIDVSNVNKTVFSSKIDVFNKHIKSFTLKYYKSYIIALFGIILNLSYYMIANQMITERLKSDRIKLTKEEQELKKDIKNKKYKLKNISATYKKIKNKKNIIDNQNMLIYSLTHNFKE